MLKFHYIKDDTALQSLVAQYQQSRILVLDTEFVRTRTYYARLGLIQVYDGQTLALIDPLDIQDLSPLWALLSDQNILKLVHSCSEDLEVFARNGNVQPSPLFDSQIAAAIAGMGHGLGYAKLVETCLGEVLDKGESRTDWIKRPLTEAQLQYAANDVFYLYRLYPMLADKLNALGRMSWVLEEGERLTEGRLAKPDLETAYLKVKNAFQLTPKQLAYLKVLAAWRLQKALDRDLALGFVIKDHALIALAKKPPQSIGDILRLNDLSEHEKRIHAKDILRVVQQADLVNLPEAVDVLALKPGYKQAFKAVKNTLTAICEAEDIPSELFCSKRHIHDYLEYRWAGNSGSVPLLLQGWRKPLAQEALSSLDLSES